MQLFNFVSSDWFMPFSCWCLQDQVFPEFVRGFLKDMFPAGDVPAWVRDAMAVAEISLEGVATTAPPPEAGQSAAPAAAAGDGAEGP
jgi:queuine tRNA-ribosyltransferase